MTMNPKQHDLLETGEQFRLLVESVQDYAIFMLDPKGRIVTWNAGAERIKGYRADEIIGKHFSCFYSNDDLMQQKPFKELEIAESVGRYEEEGWRARKDGTTFWANVVITAIREQSGQLVGFSKVTRDLTERKVAENQLRTSHEALERRVLERTEELVRLNSELAEAETRTRLMIEEIKDYAIYTLDPEGRVTSWNEGAVRIYGYTSEEIIGQSRRLFFTTEDVAQGLPWSELTAAATNGRCSEEAWRVRKNGSHFWANGAITALRDDEGKLRGFVKIVRDLTERKQAEIELQTRMELLQLRNRALQAVSQGILITDHQQPDRPIVFASPGIEPLTGYSVDELIGKSCQCFQGPKTDQSALRQLDRAIETGQPCSVEIQCYRKDGNTFWNALSISPVWDQQGNLAQFVWVQTDVTRRRALEDQLRQSQKMEAVGQLAGGIAHDFNNLLTIIFGYCDELLNKLAETDPRHASATAISEAAIQAADLTRQLLTISRKTLQESQIVDINELIADCEKMLRRVIGEDVSLTTVLDPSVGRLRVDPGQMRQVLMNLVVNARDAMPLGGKLTIETKRVELDEPYSNTHVEVAAGRYVLLSVTDNGTGMTPEIRSQIFDPFFTTKEVGRGTGLGLSVVHGIIKQSHGQIGAYTEYGVGTTFKIYLPVVGQETNQAEVVLEVPKPNVGTETILLVEDEAAVRQIALHHLQTQGYKVLSAGNGKEAIELLEGYEGNIELLLTDIVMPEMNGRELAEALKSRYPRMKVLFLSGFTNDTIIRHGILHGDVNFLPKPFTSRALFKKVREVLDKES